MPPRHARCVEFPEVEDIADQRVIAVGSLRFDLQFADGRISRVNLVPLTADGRAGLIRDLAFSLWEMAQVDGPIASPGSAKRYCAAIRAFKLFLDASRIKVGAAKDITGTTITRFEDWLYDRYEEDSCTPYGRVLCIICLLRHWSESNPGEVREGLATRLAHGPTAGKGQSVPRDAYSGRIAAALREACRLEILEATRRLTVTGPRMIRQGRSPEEFGWNDENNLVFEIAERGPLSGKRFIAEHGGYIAKRFRFEQLNGYVYPGEGDLLACAILLMLESGIEIECCRELKADCLKNASKGYVDIEYVKRRARGNEMRSKRVRDGGSTTPGGIIRTVLRLTQRAREHFGSDRLWVCCGHASLHVASFGPRPHNCPTKNFVARHGLTDDDGKPLHLRLDRLRKTHKVEWYRKTEGQLEQFADDHSVDVAANHYAMIPALEETHQQAITDALTDAFDNAINVRIVPPDEEKVLRADTEHAAIELGVPPDRVIAVLDGEQDVWLSSCKGFYASPFAKNGEPCPVAFWGCLECRNGVITARKLPAILSFLNFMLSQREIMVETDWRAKFGRAYRRIVDQILPRFPEPLVVAARAIAESDKDLLFLPADFRLT